jgi:antitoxin (DNA-binding transcriptional repressor) of toxin-antitoxin stability system
MKSMTVGEFKARFSEALDRVRAGETVVVAFGRNRRKIAALVPYSEIRQAPRRPLGVLKGKLSVRFSRDFKISDDELLSA